MEFFITDGSMVRVICYELNKKFREIANWENKLEVILNSKEFNDFLYKR